MAEKSRMERTYDVFVSYRGEDTPASFTSLLCAALQNAGITVFRDDTSLERGDFISTSLLRAIEESRISVIVFSRNYAASWWCLEELVKIMECHRTIGQVVLPVFYDVDPSEVRHETGQFGKAFRNLLNRISKNEDELLKSVLNWRKALSKASGFAGFIVQNHRTESEAIKDIVENVTCLLDKAVLLIANNPVGVEYRVQDMIQLLNSQQSNDVLLLGMWGMVGIGKTTIAKAIYNKIGHEFEGRSFLANIREVWEQKAGQVYLQEQLLFDIFKKTTAKIANIESGKYILKKSLCHKRVLLVLDDVNNLDQLNALCGSHRWFGSGSRIIITTTDKHILRGTKVDQVYMMNEMNESESFELFSWHAFKQASPKEDFAEISRNVVEYCGGLPLALEVLGSYLFDKGITEWNCVLDKLKSIPNDQVHKKLRISYDGLIDDTEKKIFLDVACFFVGMDRSDVINILNGCGFFAEYGISVLVDRSLVTVDGKNKLGMHDLLRDMGKEIIRESSLEDLEERSRLWFHEDVLDVLSKQTGTKAVEGLALKLPRGNAKHFSTKAFKNMKRLRLLQLAGIQLDGDFEYLSRNLRWLCWNGFPLTCIPTNFYQENLVSIELENSSLKFVWKETQRMENLKILNLSHSHYLIQTPDFSNLPNLEKLVLQDCPRLSEVSHSIGHLSKVLLINLKDCISLCNLPRSIYKLKSLKTLILSGCFMIDKLDEDLEQMESLTTLTADNTAITIVPFSVVRSKSIGYISLCGYEGFSREVFPSIILSWMSPANNLFSQVQTSACMSYLVSLDISNIGYHDLSSILKCLPMLICLQLDCDTEIIFVASNATNSKKLESQASEMETFALNEWHILEQKSSLKSLLIQLGTDCQVTDILKEIMLQDLSLLPGDSYPDWLTFNCEGSSVIFEVPQVEGRNLKTLICVAYSLSPDNITSYGLEILMLINHTKTTIQLYNGEALASLENEEWQRVLSNMEPGNEVEVGVIFGNGFTVKKTAVYLVYDEPNGEKMEQCHASDENFIVCRGDENVDSINRIGLPNLVQGIGREIIRQKSMDMAEARTYDVFLSFRGEGSHARFISHLYGSLQNAGIHVFRHGENVDTVKRGDENVDNTNRIGLPNLVQGMGREIVRQKSMDMAEARTYDVFLSFRGEGSDVKFIAHLYDSLQNAGIHVFKHGDEIQGGDQITVSLLQAIGQSRISIVVLSRNYANSRWCMLELVNIMESRRTRGLVVVPVFYKIDPSEVLNQTGKFGEAFEDLISRTSEDEYRKGDWKTALLEVCSIAGVVVINSRNQSENVENVVDNVTNLLDNMDLFVGDLPVRVKSRVDVIQLLNSQNSEDTLIIGIWGMGGIGKTTIAKAVYDKIRRGFEANSFLQNVRGVWKLDDGKVSLQQQLLSDIYTRIETRIDTVESGKLILQERLRRKRILLVLDDVNELDQLNALCGSREWFGQGSRIIVTTRNMKILDELEVDHVYEMKLMDDIESLELLCWYAFKQPSPGEGFADLSRDVVKYCGGLPLALVVMGFFLWGKSETEWKSALEKLKIIPHDIIMENLRLSYDDLSYSEKEIFLDIASFYIGMGQDDVIQILEHTGRFAETGIRVLVEQSLVTLDSGRRIGMHNLVRSMGKEIIRQKSMGMAEERIYDVFLSFRGEDTRAKFISHLYVSLQNAGIHVFRDDDAIQQGDQISVSLLEAIGQSRISIVVLSKNFANSKWCILELENIMEIRRSKGLVVVPIFYEVDPSEVRRQTGEFGEAFKDLISRISVDEYTERNWRTTLLEIGHVAGFVIINTSNESEDIKKVVDKVTHLLDKADLFVAEHPVGVESRAHDVIQLLNSQQSKAPLLLGIWGMGGVGKTTIAKAVYNKVRRDFEAKSVLLNVREVWKQENDKVSLQQRLLSDIYNNTKIKIDTVEKGKMILRESLRQKKIFLILDDVNELDQLSALCGSREWFGEGSRIIITTRDFSLLRKLEVNHVYRMRVMDDNESLELFSWHAFRQPIPREDFADLSRDVIKHSGGLPLALQVIGSFLLTMGRKTEWMSVLEKLKLIPNAEVLEKLRISFDGLSDDDLKEIFLDIAFFFIGMDQEDVIKVLKNCGRFPEIGISVLVQRSLITVDRKNKIGMHDLLRDMGREIVRKKSTEGGKDPSRLWRHEDVCNVLSKDTRTMEVEGLTLKLSRMDPTTDLETKAFEKMNKLRFLQLSGVQLVGDYKYLSRDLKWICWPGFPSRCTPENFHQGSLVAIDLKYSNMDRVWKKSQMLEKLKILNLSHSHNLRQTPNFSMLPNLEKLILKDCPRLSSVSTSIGHLNKILLINLKDCTGLCELPRSIYKLESVKTLILSGCTKIDKLEEDIEQMKSLTTLVADMTAITKVPFAVVRLKSIGYISLCGYEGFSRHVFPSIIQSWMSNVLLYNFKYLLNLQRLWVNCDSEAQLNEIVARILGNSRTENCEVLEGMPSTLQTSNIGTSSSIDFPGQVRTSSSTNSTSLLIQMGMNCHNSSILREDILQILQNRPLSGSSLLPGNKYPDWLTYTGNDSSVTFDVPLVDGRNLKTIMCIVSSSSPDILEGLEVVLLINCTKNTVLLCKKDALLASSSSDEVEWQRLVSNTEPGDEMKVIVAFRNGFIVPKITAYLIYDEPNKNVIIPKGDENILGRLFFPLASFARAVLISQPFWFCLAGAVVWWSRSRSDKRRNHNPILRDKICLGDVHEEVKKQGEKREPTLP